jgi:glycosyltransferase involved in cell wall biosynthesis
LRGKKIGNTAFMVSKKENEVKTAGSPVISVIMPVYNSGKYLETAIESILSQTFISFEFIIIDDGSTDNSRYLLKKYSIADKRIRVILNKQNLGNYPSRNKGMSVAKGEFIAVMDSDDIAYPERFDYQINFFRENPESVMVGSQVMLIDPEGRDLGLKPDIPLTHKAINKKLLDGLWGVIHPSVIMRKDAVDELGGYRERFRSCADHDLYLRLSEIGKIANMPEVLLSYRQHYSSMTINTSDQQHNLYYIKREARERRGLSSEQDETVPEIAESGEFTRKEKMAIRYHWAKLAFSSGHFTVAFRHFTASIVLHPYGIMEKGFNFLRSRFRDV